MAGSYDGSIRIDTAINAAPIDNGLAQIENKIKGLAATVGIAFGVKELIDFGKRSIDAASDLAEPGNALNFNHRSPPRQVMLHKFRSTRTEN